MKSNAKNQIDSRLPKPPKPPEKPLMPYMRYSRKVWEQVKNANPELKLWEVGKIIGQMWRELAEEEKARFTEDYETEKAQYNEAMRQYHNSPAYQTWLAAKERAEKALEEPEPERTKAPPAKVRDRSSDAVGDAREAYIIEDNEDDADDQLTAKHVSSARYHRNHCLMQEVLSDARLPEVRSLVSRQRLVTLKRQVDQLQGHREKLAREMDGCELKHRAKVAKMQTDSDTFYAGYATTVNSRPVITDKMYVGLVEKACIDIVEEEKQRRLDQERRLRDAEERVKTEEKRRKNVMDRQKNLEEDRRRAEVDRVIQQIQVMPTEPADAKTKKAPVKRKKPTKPKLPQPASDTQLTGEITLAPAPSQRVPQPGVVYQQQQTFPPGFQQQRQPQQFVAQWQQQKSYTGPGQQGGQQQFQIYQGQPGAVTSQMQGNQATFQIQPQQMQVQQPSGAFQQQMQPNQAPGFQGQSQLQTQPMPAFQSQPQIQTNQATFQVQSAAQQIQPNQAPTFQAQPQSQPNPASTFQGQQQMQGNQSMFQGQSQIQLNQAPAFQGQPQIQSNQAMFQGQPQIQSQPSFQVQPGSQQMQSNQATTFQGQPQMQPSQVVFQGQPQNIQSGTQQFQPNQATSFQTQPSVGFQGHPGVPPIQPQSTGLSQGHLANQSQVQSTTTSAFQGQTEAPQFQSSQTPPTPVYSNQSTAPSTQQQQQPSGAYPAQHTPPFQATTESFQGQQRPVSQTNNEYQGQSRAGYQGPSASVQRPLNVEHNQKSGISESNGHHGPAHVPPQPNQYYVATPHSDSLQQPSSTHAVSCSEEQGSAAVTTPATTQPASQSIPEDSQ